MKNSLAFISIFLAALLSGAKSHGNASPSFKEGHYIGQGRCTTPDGKKMSGVVDLNIKGTSVTWVFDPQGQKLKHEMKTKFTSVGYFNFTSPDGPSGEGYCTSTGCHYETIGGSSKDEGTLIFNGDQSVTAFESIASPTYKMFCEIVYQPAP